MTCDEVLERTALYLTEDLAADEGRALEDHLEVCDRCHAALEADDRILSALHRAGRPVATSTPSDSGRITIRPWAAAVLAALVFGAGWWAGSVDRVPSRKSSPTEDGRTVTGSVGPSDLTRARTRPTNGLSRGLLALRAASMDRRDRK